MIKSINKVYFVTNEMKVNLFLKQSVYPRLGLQSKEEKFHDFINSNLKPINKKILLDNLL